MNNLTWEQRSEKLRAFATTVAAVYPVFAGLYIFGFFWSAPFDLVGAFSFTDFLFKSAVTFFSIAAFFVAYLTFLSAYTILVVEKISGPFWESEKGVEEPEDHRQWGDLKPRELLTILVANGALVALLFGAFFLFREASDLPEFPNFLIGALVIAPAFGSMIALSVDKTRWLVLRILYWVTVGLVVPFWIGYNDFELGAGPAEVKYDSQTCFVRFIGGEKALLKCDDEDVLVDIGQLEVEFPVR